MVIILADDLGWRDIDEPSPMETPHIDALAKRGFVRDILQLPHVPQPVLRS